MIQPMDLSGALKYMDIAPGECGDDAHNCAWAEVSASDAVGQGFARCISSERCISEGMVAEQVQYACNWPQEQYCVFDSL